MWADFDGAVITHPVQLQVIVSGHWCPTIITAVTLPCGRWCPLGQSPLWVDEHAWWKPWPPHNDSHTWITTLRTHQRLQLDLRLMLTDKIRPSKRIAVLRDSKSPRCFQPFILTMLPCTRWILPWATPLESISHLWWSWQTCTDHGHLCNYRGYKKNFKRSQSRNSREARGSAICLCQLYQNKISSSYTGHQSYSSARHLTNPFDRDPYRSRSLTWH